MRDGGGAEKRGGAEEGKFNHFWDIWNKDQYRLLRMAPSILITDIRVWSVEVDST